MKVSIIIPTYRRIEQALKTVDLLLKSGQASNLDVEYIVSDSTEDNSLKNGISNKFKNKVFYIKTPKRGIAAGKNYGARVTKGSILIFCDSDIEIEEDTVEKTMNAFKRYRTAGAIGGNVIWRGGPNNGKLDRPRPEDRREMIGETTYVEALYSRYIATYKDIFWKVGGYDEEVFNMRGEGSDLSIRYWRMGYPLVFEDSIRVHHVYDAPDSMALRTSNPSYGIAKDLLLLGYKYDLFDGGSYKNFENTVIANFKNFGDEGYYNILVGIGKHFDFTNNAKPILDRQKKNMKHIYDFKFLEVFSNESLFQDCVETAANRIKETIKQE